jgi:hypothetical protein
LSTAELKIANDFLTRIRQELLALSGQDSELLFTYRRKLAHEHDVDIESVLESAFRLSGPCGLKNFPGHRQYQDCKQKAPERGPFSLHPANH